MELVKIVICQKEDKTTSLHLVELSQWKIILLDQKVPFSLFLQNESYHLL